MILLIEFWRGFLACFILFVIAAIIVYLIFFAETQIKKDRREFYDYDEIGRSEEDNIFNQF